MVQPPPMKNLNSNKRKTPLKPSARVRKVRIVSSSSFWLKLEKHNAVLPSLEVDLQQFEFYCWILTLPLCFSVPFLSLLIKSTKRSYKCNICHILCVFNQYDRSKKLWLLLKRKWSQKWSFTNMIAGKKVETIDLKMIDHFSGHVL